MLQQRLTWEHSCLQAALLLCVGNEAAMFLNSAFRLEASLLLLFCMEKTNFFIAVMPGAE